VGRGLGYAVKLDVRDILGVGDTANLARERRRGGDLFARSGG